MYTPSSPLSPTASSSGPMLAQAPPPPPPPGPSTTTAPNATTTTTPPPPPTSQSQPQPIELDGQPDEAALKQALEAYQLPATGPACWGPLQWMALHQMLRGYPVSAPSEEKQAALRQYVTAMAEVIPCIKCSMHWKQLATTVKTGSRFEALKWSIDAHNYVNKRLHKPVLTYAEAVKSMNERCANNVLQNVATTPPSSNDSGSKATSAAAANTGLVIGLSCGLAVVGVLLIALLAYFIVVRKRAGSRASLR